MIYVSEELYLLALNEEKGNILPFVKKSIAPALSGAILADLALQGKISSNEKHRVEIINSDPLGDEILDEALKEIKSSEKTRKLSYWVTSLGTKSKKLRQRFGEHLALKGILFQDESHFYWRQPSVENNQPPISTKYELKKSLRAEVLSDEAADIRSLALLNVLSGSELLNLIFTQDELSLAKRCIHEKLLRVALENPSLQTIEEIEQAISTSLDDDID
jgi:golgi phosphoprotein 3